MPVTLKVTQYDRGAAAHSFRAVATSPTLEAMARSLSGVSMLMTKTALKKNIGKEPVEVRDDQGKLRFTIEIESITF